jgi:hypothetical protein
LALLAAVAYARESRKATPPSLSLSSGCSLGLFIKRPPTAANNANKWFWGDHAGLLRLARPPVVRDVGTITPRSTPRRMVGTLTPSSWARSAGVRTLGASLSLIVSPFPHFQRIGPSRLRATARVWAPLCLSPRFSHSSTAMSFHSCRTGTPAALIMRMI